jgi:carbonic anhydrase
MKKVFLAAALAGAAALVLVAQASNPSGVQTQASQAEMTPVKALARLKEGNARFAVGKTTPRDYPAQLRATAGGQFPSTVIVSCMDSRAPVEAIFDLGLGDTFSIREAGNVIDADVLGGLEYAVKVIGVKSIVVLGHSHCGAVKGAIDGVELGNLTQLLKKIAPAIEGPVPAAKSKDDAFVARVAEANVRLGMKEIRQKSPTVREALDAGKVGLVGGMYDIETGKVEFYAD